MTEFVWVSQLVEVVAIEVKSREIEVACRDSSLLCLRDDLFIYVFDTPGGVINKWRERYHRGDQCIL
jgi:hypothetical protein